jgi:hypothetical protein
MKRWLVLAGVGLAGIILAFLLLPKPETGRVATPASTVQAPPSEAHARPAAPPGIRGAHLEGRQMLKNGPPPIALENIAKLNIPEALYAGRMTSPLAVVRRRLQLTGDPEAEALGVEADTIIGALREQRRDPEAHPMAELIDQSRAWLDRVKASAWGADPEITPQYARFDQIAAEFQQAKDNPGARPHPPGGLPLPAPPPAGE